MNWENRLEKKMTTIQVAFDTKDPSHLAKFYAEALHYKMQDPPKGYGTWEEALAAYGIPKEEWNDKSAIVDPEGIGARIFFQKMDTPKPVKNRLHIDVNASSGQKLNAEERVAFVRKEVERLVALGATKQQEWDEDHEFWVVMLDPEGNEFCVQ
jgi:Glyoxalase-like domain